MQLREYQSESVAAAWGYLCSMPGSPVIVLPTGAGKSLVIAELARQAIERWNGRVLVLAHRKELLQQNAEKVSALLPGVDVGLFSAGLRRWQADSPVVLAGIQSAWKKAGDFGVRNLVLIDEAHLVPTEDEGQYRRFLSDLRTCNPTYRMVGLTATPYRTGEGSVCGPDRLFQAVCYEAKIPSLIADGFLSPVTNKAGDTRVDVSSLHIRGGEFITGEMERLFDVPEAVIGAVREIVALSPGRRSVLVFCVGVDHAKHVAEYLAELTGERVGLVTGSTFPMERATTLADFRAGRIRFLVNVDVLTTGFDAPGIDCIAILRATCSPGLFAQICGRGFRKAPGKENCLILDFGENLSRHGPIDSIDFGERSKRTRTPGDAPTKECPACGEIALIQSRVCPCGWRFPVEESTHGTEADQSSNVLASPEKWIVTQVSMSRWTKKNAPEGTPDTLRVDYTCQPCGREGNLSEQVISEWVCMDHEGFAGDKAWKWWRARSLATPEADEAGSVIADAVSLFLRGAVATSTHITTIKEGRFYRITEHSLDPIPEEWNEAEVTERDPWEEEQELPF